MSFGPLAPVENDADEDNGWPDRRVWRSAAASDLRASAATPSLRWQGLLSVSGCQA
jgi:hypothetical protein